MKHMVIVILILVGMAFSQADTWTPTTTPGFVWDATFTHKYFPTATVFDDQGGIYARMVDNRLYYSTGGAWTYVHISSNPDDTIKVRHIAEIGGTLWAFTESSIYTAVINQTTAKRLSKTVGKPATFTLRPNPSSGSVHIKGVSVRDPMKVYNSQGKLMAVVTHRSWFPDNLAAGMYVAKTKASTQVMIRK